MMSGDEVIGGLFVCTSTNSPKTIYSEQGKGATVFPITGLWRSGGNKLVWNLVLILLILKKPFFDSDVEEEKYDHGYSISLVRITGIYQED